MPGDGTATKQAKMNLRWLLRMSQWARHPPPMSRVILGAAVIGACLLIAGIEWLGLWPDWLTLDPQRRFKP